MTLISFLFRTLSSLTAAEPLSPEALTPELLFESLVMEDRIPTADGRYWSLICGTLSQARGSSFVITEHPDYPLQLVTAESKIKSPFKMDFTPYLSQYVFFYEIIGNLGSGYFAITTPGNDFYKTPLPTMRFSAEFNPDLWPDSIKKVSFFYQQQHIGTVGKDTPDKDGRRSLNELFPNPESSYLDPAEITFTIHFSSKSKSEGHSLNPANNPSQFTPNLEEVTPLIQVPHAIRFILNFTSDTVNVSFRGKLERKQAKTTPSASICLHAPSQTPENDEEILKSFKMAVITDQTYVSTPEEAQININYPTYLDLTRDYLWQSSEKYKCPIHMPTALRTLRSANIIPASSYLGLILFELQQELNLQPDQKFYPYPHSD